MFWLISFACDFTQKVKEKQKVPLPNGFADPSEEIDHDAEKLAQEFERKYGNGYDENNGFIDDSEAVNIKFFCFFFKWKSYNVAIKWIFFFSIFICFILKYNSKQMCQF